MSNIQSKITRRAEKQENTTHNEEGGKNPISKNRPRNDTDDRISREGR